MITQVLSVPIFLSHWDRKVYGVWIAAQALTGISTIVDLGHQQYLQNELQRIGAYDRQAMRKTFWSAVPVALTIGLAQLAAAAVLFFSGYMDTFLGAEGSLARAGGLIVLAYLASWIFVTSFGGLAIRVVAPFGYYARFAWMSVFTGIIPAVFPMIAVLLGCSLTQTGMVWVGSLWLMNIPIHVEFYRIFVRERLHPAAPDWRHRAGATSGSRNCSR